MSSIEDTESSPTLPPEIAEHFGSPRVLRSENAAKYNRLQTAMIAAIRPTDVLGAITCSRITEALWEADRICQIKVFLINGQRGEAIHTLLEARDIDHDTIDRIVAWDTGKARDKADAMELLERYQIDEESIDAQCTVLAFPELNQLDAYLDRLDRRVRTSVREEEHRQIYLAWRESQMPTIVESTAAHSSPTLSAWSQWTPAT